MAAHCLQKWNQILRDLANICKSDGQSTQSWNLNIGFK